MSLYINVGAIIRWPADAGRDTVRKFGESFELPDSEAREAIIRNTPMLSKADFEAIGFTGDELARFASPGSWDGAPATFQSKLRACWAKLHQVRETLKAPPQPLPPPPAAQEE